MKEIISEIPLAGPSKTYLTRVRLRSGVASIMRTRYYVQDGYDHEYYIGKHARTACAPGFGNEELQK